MKKQILIVPSIILVLLIALILWSNWNNIFFKSVDSHKVTKINLKVEQLYNYDINTDIESQDSINAIIDLENLVRKNDGTNFLIKAKPWNIEIEYSLISGDKVIRKYKGQSILVELQNKLSNIPEINKEMSIE